MRDAWHRQTWRSQWICRDKNGTVKLLNPSGKVSHLLQITRLEAVLEIYRNEEEALRSF